MPLSKLNYKRPSPSPELVFDFADDRSHSKKKKKHKRSRSRSTSPSHRHRSDHDRRKNRHDKPLSEPPTENNFNDDDDWIPPSSAHKPDADWQQHLFDAMAEDEGGDFYAAQFYHTNWHDDSNGSTSNSKSNQRGRSRVDLMSEEEYRRYIVNGVRSRIAAKDPARRLREAQRRAERAKKATNEKEREREREVEREREMEREARRRLRGNQDVVIARATYVSRWNKLLASSSKGISVKDVPWPVVGEVVTKEDVANFIVGGTADQAERKKLIRTEQMRFHPDKFLQRLGERLAEGRERKKVLERVNEVSSVLNELWSGVNG
ncbi:hypothetical protein BC938DRAFT_480977 [Jimgerdemannia flammicorona]|uniref:Uncharacterized protein n=1 Tax=Jimgerdemannia flammicorona TaxID=994334 RepID=A0A433QH77_9FUNG|nr:hypothetical protein BC938DRAFT_480977 [Jimgerdemannia flammicorona]